MRPRGQGLFLRTAEEQGPRATPLCCCAPNIHAPPELQSVMYVAATAEEQPCLVPGRGRKDPSQHFRREQGPADTSASRRRESTPAVEAASLRSLSRQPSRPVLPGASVTAHVPATPRQGPRLTGGRLSPFMGTPNYIGRAPLTFLLKFTNSASFHLELSQIWGLCSAGKQNRMGRK